METHNEDWWCLNADQVNCLTKLLGSRDFERQILLFFGVGAMEVAVDDDIRRPKAAVAHYSHPQVV